MPNSRSPTMEKRFSNPNSRPLNEARFSKTISFPWIVACLALAPFARAEVDFARDIQPILNARCTECHGGVKAAGDVSFVYQDRVINYESDSGYPVVKPGNLKESELIYRITTDDEDDSMPPPDDHEPLSKKEVDLIKQWVEEGAKWSNHWAFVPPARSPVPTSSFDNIAKNNIDRFLFHRLEAEGLKPGPTENPGRLLRRLSLGLTGLPPNLDELNRFESAHAKNPDNAVKIAVDDLLSRPAFGERWAAMWLDLVRYADSGGLGQDQKRTIWAYRDWVVDAFNQNLPFDQFTIKQLAGDLLPNPSINDLVATACQRNTQTNNEGGTDDETFRVEAVLDRVNTTWQTWGSITFSCVQCHDHPYDPIRHAEYYQFMDFFNNSADSDLPKDEPLLKVPKDPNIYSDAAALRQEVLQLKKELWKEGTKLRDDVSWTALNDLEVTSNNSSRYAVDNKAAHAEFHTVGTVETKTHTLIDAPHTNFGDTPVTALRLTVLPLRPKTSIHSPEWGFVLAKSEAWIVSADGKKNPVKFRWSVPDVPWMPTAPTGNIGPDGADWGADSRIHHARRLVLVPENPILIPKGGSLALRFHCNKTGHGSHPMAIQRGHLASTSDPRWSKLGKGHCQAGALKERLFLAENRLARIPGTTVPIMQPRPTQVARPTHIFTRGNSLEKADRVSAGLPASLLEVAPVNSAKKTHDRLDMAQWWVSDSHPLTARVFVNRLWEQLFGVGLVPTLEDFGSSGEKPTHKELLDYLAVRFQKDHHWNIKAILREMVLSHAYQQSARMTPALVEHDPDNRLLARGPRIRLPAETIRDQALATSGLLSTKIGGPPVHPPLPEGVWRPFEKGDKWETPAPNEEDRYRRSIYTYTKRSIPYPSFAMFDAPSREFCNPRRLTSNTPLQALAILNDPAFVECAEAFGKRINTELSGPIEEKLNDAHRLVTGRPANAERLTELVNLYHNTASQYGEPMPEAGPSYEAWTVIAQVLMNLDETLTY
ncbi:MAG: PSD1 and planctomycete cytochrome C domain-containing protein [Verrucomicrobiota bacterium]